MQTFNHEGRGIMIGYPVNLESHELHCPYRSDVKLGFEPHRSCLCIAGTWAEDVPDVPVEQTDHLPADAKDRKGIPLATGVIDYFPDAMIALAKLSRIGNDQHNPGKPLHWDRSKSQDHDDCLIRHFIDRGKVDTDGVRHRTKVLWRAAAALQLELEAEKKK